MSGRALIGVWGKLPARGDFVRVGLPRDFTDPYDAWWQRELAGFQAAAGSDWTRFWLEAPVWRFSFAGGICGAAPVLGVWMPSVDRAGRYFPLTLAAVGARSWNAEFLAAAEEAGREAVAADLAPDEVIERLFEPDGAGDPLEAGTGWVSDGGTHVPPGGRRFPGLPTGAAFRDMIDANSGQDDRA